MFKAPGDSGFLGEIIDSNNTLLYIPLKIAGHGPGFCHFPSRYDDEHLKQITAEQLVTRFNRGYRTRERKKVRRRNEALDCRLYALAAFTLSNVRVNTVAACLERVEPA